MKPIRRIEELDVTLSVPRGTKQLRERRRRCETAFMRGAENALGKFSGRPGDGVWIIDEIGIEVAHPTTNEGNLAAFLASQFAEALERKILEGGAGVRFFPSRAHFRAAFLSALTRGTAFTGTAFGHYDGLANLSASRAASTVLKREVVDALATVAHLPPLDRERVAKMLGEEGLKSVLLYWTRQLGSVGSEAAVTVSYGKQRVSNRRSGIAVSARSRVFLELCRSPADEARYPIEVLAKAGAIAASQTSGIHRVAGPEELLSALIEAVPEFAHIQDQVQAFLEQPSSVEDWSHEEPLTPDAIFSKWLGLVLLVPSIDAILDAIGSQDHTLRGAIVCACAGDARVLDDPVIRQLFALEGARPIKGWLSDIAREQATEWVRALRQRYGGSLLLAGERAWFAEGLGRDDTCGARVAILLAATAYRHFASRLVGFGDSSVSFLFAQCISGGGEFCPVPSVDRCFLAPRPLGSILSYSGLTRGEVCAQWSKDRPIRIGLIS